jgi:hypothetical protein
MTTKTLTSNLEYHLRKATASALQLGWQCTGLFLTKFSQISTICDTIVLLKRQMIPVKM